MDVFDEIATGVRPAPALSNPPKVLGQRDQALSYALVKKVPDMVQRGFTIQTAYGEISIEPGRVANAIAATVRAELQRQFHGGRA